MSTLRLKFFIVFIVLAVVSAIFINRYYQSVQQERLELATKTYTRAYDTAYKEKQRLSKVLLSGLQEMGSLPQRLVALQSATKEQKDKIREDIYQDLKVRHEQLKTMGISQLHIHLPNNESFLRMHEPDIYGDNLTAVRPSVALTNQNHKACDGIEIGVVNTGLRFVYPIFYKNIYVGSMEISHEVGAITSSIMQQYYVLCNFFVKEDIVDKKQLKDIKNKYYKPSHHKGYLYDKIVLKELEKVSREDMKKLKPEKQITDKILEIGQKDTPSSVYDKSIDSIFTIIPIVDKTTKENIGFLTVRSKANYPTDYIYFIYVLSVGVLALAGYLLYVLVSKKDELAQIVQEKTEELNDINKNLEQKVEEKTKEQSSLLSLFDKGDVVLFRWNNDESWNIDFVSDNAEQLLGYTKEEFAQNHIAYAALIHNDDIELVTKEVTDAVTQNKDFLTHKPYRVTTKDGKIKWIFDNTLLVKDEQGNVTHFLGYISDITDIKNQEEILKQKIEEALKENIKQLEILQQQSKLASMGEMIGAIAHQWRQPLNAVSISIQNTKYDFEDGEIDETYIKNFIDGNRKAINFMSKTIDDFRDFFRVDKEKRDFKVLEAIQSVASIQSAQLKNHNISLNISGDEFLYNGLKSEFQQAILNLINNAKDVLVEKDIKNPTIDITIKDNSVYIEDNGGGIPKDIINRIFEPYFTTKEQGKGTGMGLYISKMIIEDNMGGKLSVTNTDVGAKFKIDLNEQPKIAGGVSGGV